jgi:hypothetical protein
LSPRSSASAGGTARSEADRAACALVPAEEEAPPPRCEPESTMTSTITSSANASAAASLRRRKRASPLGWSGARMGRKGEAERLRVARSPSSKSQFQRGLMDGC